MPTYEYRCTRCHHQFDAVHAVGKTVDRCERCGGAVRRLFSVPALIFKGSGFYVTDNRKSPAPSDGDGKAEGGKAAAESKSSEAKSPESKSSEIKSQESKTSGAKSSETTSSDSGSKDKGKAASSVRGGKKAS